MKRKHGEASVEEHPKGSGKWRVRARVNGKQTTLASKLDRANALEAARAYQGLQSATALKQGVTLTAFGIGFLERRARAGVRAVGHDKSQWIKHVDGDPIGGLAVTSLELVDLLDWLDRKTHLAHATRTKLRNLVRTALGEAVSRGLIKANPARELKVHKSSSASATDNLDGILLPAEQIALLNAVPEEERPCVEFALFTGLRQAEQWWLHWEDVSEEQVVVRRSTGGKPPKSGRPRLVDLLPPAKRAIGAMFGQVRTIGKRKPRTFAVRDGVFVFPAERGTRRMEGEAPRGWHAWVKAAGITRRVRWHDLRHTCATSLLAGWWGRKWSLDEVCKLLGHSSVAVTERYARKLGETLRAAVAATPVLLFPGGNETPPKALIPAAFSGKDQRFPKAKVASSILAGGAERIQLETSGFASGAEPVAEERGEHPGNIQRAKLARLLADGAIGVREQAHQDSADDPLFPVGPSERHPGKARTLVSTPGPSGSVDRAGVREARPGDGVTSPGTEGGGSVHLPSAWGLAFAAELVLRPPAKVPASPVEPAPKVGRQ